MNMVRALVTLTLVTLAVLNAGGAIAQDSPLQFLHALQDHGYGDMAIEYMNILNKQRAVPPEMRETWDLEMSKSYRASAANPFDDKDYEHLMGESQKHLEKFILEKPDNPEAVAAMAGWAEFLTRRALQLIRQAKALDAKDKEKRETALADARASLADARANIEQAEKRFKARLAELSPPPQLMPKKNGRPDTGNDAREQAEANIQAAQFQLALVDYYVAQTYPNPRGADHLAALKKAAKAFDDIFQHERTRGTITGLYAHMWHGKTCEELGDFPTALEIYDEVLASAPEPGETSQTTGLEPLFAQVEYSRLQILTKQDPQKFFPEATAWLKSYNRFKSTDGYQGVSLEVAKTLLARGARLAPTERQRLSNEAMRILSDMVKVNSQYQAEANRLLRDLRLGASQGKAGQEKVDASSFDEAVAMGQACMTNAQWDKAVEWFCEAIRLAAKAPGKDPSRVDEVRDALNAAQLNLARDLFNKGKLNECIEMAEKAVRDEQGNVKKASTAAQVSAVAVAAALNLYREAPENKKPAALERLVKVAEFTEKNWPDRPEADDGRMARGQAKLDGGQIADAIAIFERVNPKSERYPVAAYMAGQSYMRLYFKEKEKPENTRDNAQTAASRAKAIERLSAGLEIVEKKFDPGGPLPKYFLETQLLLAEIRNEGGETKEAAALYQPLVEIIKEEKPQTLDRTTLRIFLGAVRTHCALNELDKAGDASALLIDLGPDALEVNETLIGFAKLLNLERKKASAVVTQLENASQDQELNAAKVRLASVQALLGKILLKLAPRQELSLQGKVFLGETLETIGFSAEASEQFQRILDRAKTDKAYAQAAQRAMPLVRTKLLTALREQGKFDEALKQVDQLIKENPNALEPLLEKGQILEAWAEKNPARFDEAVAHWTMVRNKLQPLAKKPDAYYDVNYNVANCLVREAERSKDKAIILDRARKAEQVLKSPLVLSPKLNGPDAVERYKVLLKRAIELQGRSAEPKDAKQDAKKDAKQEAKQDAKKDAKKP